MSASPPVSISPDRVSTLYCDHNQWLRGWLRKKLGCADKAADLAHDTFIRVLAGQSIPEELIEPRAFLTAIAHRVLLNHWRREKIEQAYLEALAQVPEPWALSPEDRAILLETLLELDRLLDGLKVAVRRAFLMTQLDGLSHAQVAAELGVSIPTVKRYIVKALQQCYFADLRPPA